MAQVMEMLTRVSDSWSAMTDTAAPPTLSRDERRLELLGALVQLVGRRSHGFREVPSRGDLSVDIQDGAIELRLRSRGRVPIETGVVERQLAKLGFVVERVPGTEGREVRVGWSREHLATVVELPRQQRRHAKPRRA